MLFSRGGDAKDGSTACLATAAGCAVEGPVQDRQTRLGETVATEAVDDALFPRGGDAEYRSASLRVAAVSTSLAARGGRAVETAIVWANRFERCLSSSSGGRPEPDPPF